MPNNTISLSSNQLFSYLHFLRKKKNNEFHNYMRFRELKNIVNQNTLTTFFQPILDLKTYTIVGYEALNRPPVSKWFPSTEQFYQFIGSTNQIFFFDLYCRNAAIKQYASNVKEVPTEKDKLLFINVHPDVLIDSEYRQGETIQLLEEFGLKPNQIVFELTEKKAVTDFYMFEKILYNYRTQGFRLAIDDVGTGYNSLKTIVHLCPEFIKLDKSLIHNIVDNDPQQKMVSLLLNFANQSKSYVIAEGIEQVEDLQFLKQEGLHFGQGYALGRPNQKIQHFVNH